MALYVKFAIDKRPRTVRDFIRKFYTGYVTLYYAKGHATFYDAGCVNVHCHRDYRSFDDLLELVQTYYPSIKPVKLMHYLLTTKIPLTKDSNSYPNLGTCSGMGKIRFIPYNSPAFSDIDRVMPNSKFTWRQLITPLGIKDEKDFKEYYTNRQV